MVLKYASITVELHILNVLMQHLVYDNIVTWKTYIVQ
jgi:hypothetical protein